MLVVTVDYRGYPAEELQLQHRQTKELPEGPGKACLTGCGNDGIEAWHKWLHGAGSANVVRM